uniref:Uncharacterized protein n=1 Tax=viral metagenome TaxID=1070528 RepID=A0A6C0J6C6_9ZZZZ
MSSSKTIQSIESKMKKLLSDMKLTISNGSLHSVPPIKVPPIKKQIDNYSVCSWGSYCHNYWDDLKEEGHHKHQICIEKDCAYTFGCPIKENDYCHVDKWRCTQCCIKGNHAPSIHICSVCNIPIPTSCTGVVSNSQRDNGKCNTCDVCTVCERKIYLAGQGNAVSDCNIRVCQSCYNSNNRHIKCVKRKCERRIISNTYNMKQLSNKCSHKSCK